MKPTYEELYEMLNQALSEIQVLREENKALKARVSELEEKLNTNSRNSSKSPSQDPYRKRKGNKKSSGKKQGAQNGHKGNSRAMIPSDEVSEFKDIRPDECPHCQGKDFDIDPTATEVRQVTELPEIQAEVTQYNIHTCTCVCCGKQVKATTPSVKGAVPCDSCDSGKRLQHFVSYRSELLVIYSLLS